jgi:hypothetical protein
MVATNIMETIRRQGELTREAIDHAAARVVEEIGRLSNEVEGLRERDDDMD